MDCFGVEEETGRLSSVEETVVTVVEFDSVVTFSCPVLIQEQQHSDRLSNVAVDQVVDQVVQTAVAAVVAAAVAVAVAVAVVVAVVVVAVVAVVAVAVVVADQGRGQAKIYLCLDL